MNREYNGRAIRACKAVTVLLTCIREHSGGGVKLEVQSTTTGPFDWTCRLFEWRVMKNTQQESNEG